VEQQSREATVGSRAATADIPWAPLVSQIDHVTVKPELVPGSSDRCSSNERTSRKLEGNEAAMPRRTIAELDLRPAGYVREEWFLEGRANALAGSVEEMAEPVA